jgi:SAM-dependent methyltransferase
MSSYNPGVHPEIFERLRALNHEFYQTFAEHFADKRARLQPGVLHALEHYPPKGSILDLGSGHGALADELITGGYQGAYLGLDLSEGMNRLAREAVRHPRVHFVQADLSQNAWREVLDNVSEQFRGPFTNVYSFACLHHIPGGKRRRELIQEVSGMMDSGGNWILSVWDFMQSNRLRKRILPWESVGVDPDDVEQRDYLIDWRHGGQGVRYVHHFSIEALEKLAKHGGFEVVTTFHMDGEEGLLGLYQVWRKP